MDKNGTFVGKVNDKTYYNVEDYNKAFLDAVSKDGAVTASIEFKTVDTEQEQSYDHCLPDFDLDALTGIAETDTPIIDHFIKQDLSADRIKNILDQADKMNTTDRTELGADVKDMAENIGTDIEDNNRAHITLLKDMSVNEREINKLSLEINQLRAKLDNLKENKNKIQTQINITEGADRVLSATLDFYNTLYKQLNKNHQAEEPSVKVTGRAVDAGNPGFILDHAQKEIARKLFKEILGI